MYCGECGAKNKSDDAFCAECGAKLENEVIDNNTVNVHSSIDSNQTVNVKSKKAMTKKNKIIIISIIAVIFIFGVLYKVGSELTSPKKVAEEYIKAVVSKDGNKLYEYLEISGDNTFTSKETFNDAIKETGKDSKIVNYTITDVKYETSKLNATVTYTYTTKENKYEQTDVVYLTKQKNNKFLIFDNWQVNSDYFDVSTVKNFKLNVVKGSKVVYGGVEVLEKYLDDEDSTKETDVYVLPQVFSIQTKIKATLPSGVIINDTVTPSSYIDEYAVTFSEDSLSNKEKTKIIDSSQEFLTTVYTNAIAKKGFADVKPKFEHDDLNLTNLEEDYTELVSDLEDASNTLTSITFNDITIYDIELDDNSNLEVELKVKYDYSIKYKIFMGEEKTKSDSDYSYMTVILELDDGAYYLVGLDNMETYFSRY